MTSRAKGYECASKLDGRRSRELPPAGSGRNEPGRWKGRRRATFRAPAPERHFEEQRASRPSRTHPHDRSRFRSARRAVFRLGRVWSALWRRRESNPITGKNLTGWRRAISDASGCRIIGYRRLLIPLESPRVPWSPPPVVEASWRRQGGFPRPPPSITRVNSWSPGRVERFDAHPGPIASSHSRTTTRLTRTSAPRESS